jgi:hypothetical protein
MRRAVLMKVNANSYRYYYYYGPTPCVEDVAGGLSACDD